MDICHSAAFALFSYLMMQGLTVKLEQTRITCNTTLYKARAICMWIDNDVSGPNKHSLVHTIG